MSELTTTELVTLAKKGDERAWSLLIARYQRVVWAATYAFRLDRDSRDDVFQLTWLHLFDCLGKDKL